MLILTPWTEHPVDFLTAFAKWVFWVQVTSLSDDWYLARIGKKLLGHLRDCHSIMLIFSPGLCLQQKNVVKLHNITEK